MRLVQAPSELAVSSPLDIRCPACQYDPEREYAAMPKGSLDPSCCMSKSTALVSVLVCSGGKNKSRLTTARCRRRQLWQGLQRVRFSRDPSPYSEDASFSRPFADRAPTEWIREPARRWRSRLSISRVPRTRSKTSYRKSPSSPSSVAVRHEILWILCKRGGALDCHGVLLRGQLRGSDEAWVDRRGVHGHYRPRNCSSAWTTCTRIRSCTATSRVRGPGGRFQPRPQR